MSRYIKQHIKKTNNSNDDNLRQVITCLVASDMGNHVEYDVLFTFLDHLVQSVMMYCWHSGRMCRQAINDDVAADRACQCFLLGAYNAGGFTRLGKLQAAPSHGLWSHYQQACCSVCLPNSGVATGAFSMHAVQHCQQVLCLPHILHLQLAAYVPSSPFLPTSSFPSSPLLPFRASPLSLLPCV